MLSLCCSTVYSFTVTVRKRGDSDELNDIFNDLFQEIERLYADNLWHYHIDAPSLCTELLDDISETNYETRYIFKYWKMALVDAISNDASNVYLYHILDLSSMALRACNILRANVQSLEQLVEELEETVGTT